MSASKPTASPDPAAVSPPAPSRPILLSGNEAIARGAREAGVRVAAGYPGTPSTEILESLVRMDPGRQVYMEWSTNEKVGLDVALGAAMGGARALCAMKHVGLNVAADTFMTAAYTGVRAGLVVVSADDPGIHSSQNEQDNRLFARFAGVPMLEPADSQEARDFTVEAFALSERFDVPVLIRTTTRVSHARGVVAPGQIQVAPVLGFERAPAKFVMLPAHARPRHRDLLQRLEAMEHEVERSPLNRVEWRGRAVGVVTSGIAYHYVREVFPEASVLKLGWSHPLPRGLVRELAAGVGRLLVVEELEPFLEEQVRALGLAVEGKTHFSRVGELAPESVRRGFELAGCLPPTEAASRSLGPTLTRPPVMCPGCPHVAPFLALRALGAVVAGDIGCYTLAATEPLTAMDSTVAMGSSIGMAIGLARSGGAPGPVVAAIGDSTFLHAGIPALADAAYNGTRMTVLILDNATTAMTGGQAHPAAGVTIRGDAASVVDLPELCRVLGASSVRVVDPYDIAATHVALEQAAAAPGLSVVITNRPCVEAPAKVRDHPFHVLDERCTACQACMNLGCPSITWSEAWHDGRRKVQIDVPTCTGCTLCAQVCPTEAMVPVPGWSRKR
ncbi:MAG: indolepyruvate ferredoxin oxidoreductase subunit alpha [Candidatus Rokubacteria bacterium]|nr:indolepyruvate ferredoxin oxidoreductase subunit alpha [Candidatus Rokubacteria bacterium]MBI2526022.1 indolepyruvate ferredoxin oxidoreductase subunit alpha [Candidatus Rokubacteria bacterium]